MIPFAPSALKMLSQRILTQLVPDAGSVYSASDSMMVGMLLDCLVNEMEEGIERRLQDIRVMKALFERARERLDSDALPAGFEDVLSQQPSSMTMKDVNAVHDAHTRVLISLHGKVDSASPGEAEQAVNLDIWKYLGEHARRHALNTPL